MKRLIVPFLLIMGFLACQKDEETTVEQVPSQTEEIAVDGVMYKVIKQTNVKINDTTEQFYPDVDRLDFNDANRAGPAPIGYTTTISFYDYLTQGTPQNQTLTNLSKVDSVYWTKLSGSAGINGVAHYLYKVKINFKTSNTDNLIIDKCYVAVSANQGNFVVIPNAVNSLLYVTNKAKWEKITINGGLTDYGDIYYGIPKKYYDYKTETDLGPLLSTKKEGTKPTSNIWVAFHK